MTENQGKFIIRILMFLVYLSMHKSGYAHVASINTIYEDLTRDYANGQVF